MKFIEQHAPIDVVASLKDVYFKNKRLWEEKWEDTKRLSFAYPISLNNITKTFGLGARQMMSGQSVVIMNSTMSLVYKIPMNFAEISRLKDLLEEEKSTSIGFPISSKVVGWFTYFTYHLYLSPLSPGDIKRYLYWYLQSLVQIVKQLHKLPFGHKKRKFMCGSG